MSNPPLSRSALLMWSVAVAMAAYPTWEEWRFRLQPGGIAYSTCMGWGRPFDVSPLVDVPWPDAVRGDLEILYETGETWGVPALLVLLGFFACLGWKDPRRVGRQVAGLLMLAGAVGPLTPMYGDPAGCGVLPVFSAGWFDVVKDVWRGEQVCLALSAVSVLVASRLMRPTWPEQPVVPQPGTATAWRRLLAVLADYLIIIGVLTLVVQPILFLTGADGFFPSMHLDAGLLNRIALFEVNHDPLPVAAVPLIFLYFWVQHTLWGRTLGKRLLQIRVVTGEGRASQKARWMALRALLFPVLAVAPMIGPFALILDGLAALFDPDDRTLHDRLTATRVVRQTPSPVPQP